jgi:hypothetical protein
MTIVTGSKHEVWCIGLGRRGACLGGKRTARGEDVVVSAFREHFLDKYFAYRRRYVDYILGCAPNRGVLANLSEVVRLGFTLTGSLLIAAILWFLTVLSASRAPLGTVVYALMALAATAAAAGAVAGIVTALRDRRRVQERAAAAANAPSR